MTRYNVSIGGKQFDYYGKRISRGHVSEGMHDVHLWGETSTGGLVHLDTVSRRVLDVFGAGAVGGLWVALRRV